MPKLVLMLYVYQNILAQFARMSFAIAMLLAMGCTKGVPTIENLDNSTLPQPQFSGATSKSILKTSSGTTTDIAGECDPKIQNIIASLVGVANSSSIGLTAVASSVLIQCQENKTFSFTLKSLSNLGFVLADNTTYVIELRGVTVAGVSRASTLHLLYSASGGTAPKRFVLTSGGTESSSGERIASTGSNYKAQIRIDHRSNFVVDSTAERAAVIEKTSTSYRMKIGSAVSAD